MGQFEAATFSHFSCAVGRYVMCGTQVAESCATKDGDYARIVQVYRFRLVPNPVLVFRQAYGDVDPITNDLPIRLALPADFPEAI
jgi:hypothetical protein